MFWTNNSTIDKLENQLGSRFQAINVITDEVRNLITKYPVLSQLDALSWVIDKVPPKSLSDPRYHKDHPDRLLQEVDEVCKYVSSNNCIRRAVYISTAKSLKLNYIVFDLEGVDIADQSRVRILVRKLFHLHTMRELR